MAVLDGAVLSSKQEKQRIGDLTSAAEMDVNEGDVFFLLSSRWWKRWRSYVGADSGSALEDGTKDPASYFSAGAEGISLGSARPGEIDNSDLLVDGPQAASEEPELREALVEDQDYVILPAPVWKALHQWYGGGPVLTRNVVSMGQRGELNVEVYPLRLELVRGRPPVKLAICRISKRAKVSKLELKVAEIFQLKIGEFRLWDYFNGKRQKIMSDGEQIIEDAQIQMGQQILVEEKVNEQYLLPDEPESSNGKLELAIVPMADPTAESASIAGGPLASKPASTSNGGSSLFRFGTRSQVAGDRGGGDGAAPRGLTGLQNLGNTCFMNSALQCLVHTPQLVQFFTGNYDREINRRNPLGMEGELALAFGKLLNELWAAGSNGPVPPRAFKTKLARFAPQFSGYNQHDSQELLAFLLDGLHEDLNRVQTKPYIEAKEADGRPDDQVAAESWANHKARNDSVIVDVCQGQYKSTLICPECKKKSVTFDPFMYLSLPLPPKTTRSMSVLVHANDGATLPKVYTVSVLKNGKVKDLVEALAKACDLDADSRFFLVEVYDHKITRPFDDRAEALTNIQNEDKLVAYILPKTAERLLAFTHRREDNQGYFQHVFSRLLAMPLVTVIPEGGFKSGTEVFNALLQLLRPIATDKSTSATPTEQTPRLPGPEGLPLVLHLTNGELGRADDGASSSHQMQIDFDDRAASKVNSRLETGGAAPSGDAGTPKAGSYPRLAGDEAGARDGGAAEGEEPPPANLPFKLWLTDEKTVGKEMAIEWGRPAPPALSSLGLMKGSFKGRYVLVDWTGTKLDSCGYDLSKLEMPVDMVKNTVTQRKTRQEAISLYACLDKFLQQEPLGPEDMWYCPQCKEHRQATKKLDLWRLPEILVVHLKRFTYSRWLKNKLDTFVDFPIRNLDFTQYVDSRQGKQEYELYAVSNHYGGLGGGHYTAYAKLIADGKWYNFDDSHVAPVASEEDVKTSAAYVLFYKRVSHPEANPAPSEVVRTANKTGAAYGRERLYPEVILAENHVDEPVVEMDHSDTMDVDGDSRAALV